MQFLRFTLRASAHGAVLVCLLAAGVTSVVRAQDTTATRARVQDTTATANLRATPAGQTVVVTLRDGSALIGRVLEVTPDTVRFSSAIGETNVPRDVIVSIRVNAVGTEHNGEIWPADPSRTRLFFAPTGRMMRQDEVYFADAFVVLPSFQAGLAERFSIGAGVSLFPGVNVSEQVYYLTPKVGVYVSPNVNVSVGALVAGAKVVSDNSPFGMGYGVATFGGEDVSVTTGAGFAFAKGNSSSNAVLLLGGSTRVTRNISLLSENYLYTGAGSTGLMSGGVRFLAEKIAVDLALFTTPGMNGVPFPYVSFLYRF